MIIILITIFLTIIYGWLVYKLISFQYFKRPSWMIITSFLIFILLHTVLLSLLGYPTNQNLPNEFRLLYFYKNDNKIIILLKPNDTGYARLHELDYSLELESSLSQAMDSANKGRVLMGVLEEGADNVNSGIKFIEIKRNLPTK